MSSYMMIALIPTTTIYMLARLGKPAHKLLALY
jgi:hypothetical protein